MYLLTFSTRYLDLFWVPPWWSWWNFVLKIFYIASSAYIVFLMMRVYARTRERETAWRLSAYSLGGSVVLAPFVSLIFDYSRFSFSETIWTSSIILESVCVLPQLLLLRQTSVPTVLDSFYLVTLGSYRFFYILNWIVRLAQKDYFSPTSAVFGLIQTALYVDFAWVYWSRQRVKLRGGGVVDSDDFSKSFLVRRFLGRSGGSSEEDISEEDEGLARQENGVVKPSERGGSNWGARGISVSADDTLADEDRVAVPNGSYKDTQSEQDARMADPSNFEDDDEEDAEDVFLSNVDEPAVANSAGEWREDDDDSK